MRVKVVVKSNAHSPFGASEIKNVTVIGAIKSYLDHVAGIPTFGAQKSRRLR